MSIYSEYVVDDDNDDYIIFDEKDINKPGFNEEFMKYQEEFCTFPSIRVDTNEQTYTYMSLLDFAMKYLDKNTKSRLHDVLNRYLTKKLNSVQNMMVAKNEA